VTLGGKSWSICYWYKCDTTQINGGYVFGFMQDNYMNFFSNCFNKNALSFFINNGMNSKTYISHRIRVVIINGVTLH